MRKGILRDFVWVHSVRLGQAAIEDCETHQVELVDYGISPNLSNYKGKVVYWECDSEGMLLNLLPLTKAS